MSTYVIGDVQGCFDELNALLGAFNYDAARDTLWFTGDLVNRGRQSLETLRFVRALDRVVAVLGNHDLHCVALAHGRSPLAKSHTLREILEAPDRDALIDWLRHRPLLHYDPDSGFLMVHAGLPPQWDLALARRCAQEVEAVLHGEDYRALLSSLYGDQPDLWDTALQGGDRLRFILNCFTRLRVCDAQGRLDLKYKGPLGGQPSGFMPWFDVPWRRSKAVPIVFGHWAALNGRADVADVYPLDTGCVWGGRLTALRLEDRRTFFIPCPPTRLTPRGP